MSFVINTNMLSEIAQRQLKRTQPGLQTAMTRLSSGLRINSAADDAAGLAIGTRMTTQIRGLTVAVRNANDGLSIVQTAEGAVEEIVNNLQRIRELSLQAMSGQYSASDISYMQLEVDALVEEIGRTADQTRFNNRSIFDGYLDLNLHASYKASDSAISIAVSNMQLNGDNTMFMQANNAYTAGTTTITGNNGQTFTTGYTSTTNPFGVTYLQPTITMASSPASLALSGGVVNTAANTNQTVTFGNNDIFNASNMGALINSHRFVSGINTTTGAPIYSYNSPFYANLNTITSGGPLTLQQANGYYSSLVMAETQQYFSSASNTIAVVDATMNFVVEQRSYLGAKANQLEAAIRNMDNQIETTTASRSRIMDADFAAETANLTKSLILQQAGISVLSQANSIPQNILALLR